MIVTVPPSNSSGGGGDRLGKQGCNGDAEFVTGHRQAEALAEWAWNRLVNRADVWGGYRPLHERGKEYRRLDGTRAKLGPTTTRPLPSERGNGHLSNQVLVRHFRAHGPAEVVGLHTTSQDNTSLWGATEVDDHGPDSNDPEVDLRASLAWYQKLVGLGFHPLLTDSNGQIVSANAALAPSIRHQLPLI